MNAPTISEYDLFSNGNPLPDGMEEFVQEINSLNHENLLPEDEGEWFEEIFN